jgi:hypothetical protein
MTAGKADHAVFGVQVFGVRSGTQHRTPEHRTPSTERRVLEAIADLLSRQRAAILARDGRALNRLFEALLAPMEDLAVIAGLAGGPQPGPEEGSADALPALVRYVYEQLAINRALIHNGMTITDHYVAAVSEAAASAHQALFSGVG